MAYWYLLSLGNCETYHKKKILEYWHNGCLQLKLPEKQKLLSNRLMCAGSYLRSLNGSSCIMSSMSSSRFHGGYLVFYQVFHNELTVAPSNKFPDSNTISMKASMTIWWLLKRGSIFLKHETCLWFFLNYGMASFIDSIIYWRFHLYAVD